MKKSYLFILWSLFTLSTLSNNSFSMESLLKKLHPNDLKIEKISGYEILLDQIFKINKKEGGNTILFATKLNEVPKIFLLDPENKIIDSMELPNIISSWELTEVKAVAGDWLNFKNKTIRFLCIMNFSPPSGVSGSWDQAFVIDLSDENKFFFDIKINKKLSEIAISKKPIANISELKRFLK